MTTKDEIFEEATNNTKAATDAMLDKAFGFQDGNDKKLKELEKGKETADVPTEPVLDVQQLLSELPNGPKPKQIAEWKGQFDDVYVLPLDITEMYIWRPLRRLEYKNMVKGDAPKDDESFREAVVLRALLWPTLTPDRVAATRAGLVDTLFQVIMQGSYFLNPDFALSLVQKL